MNHYPKRRKMTGFMYTKSFQMYEQRKKNINKASVYSLYRIAKVFGCKTEVLIEK